MFGYLLRRVAYGLLVLAGINLVTFVLFFQVNTPDDIARLQLGAKRVTPEAIANLQEVRNFRDSQNNLAGIGLMDASFNRLAPTLRASALQQFQTRTGVPIQDVQFEQQRYALQGRGRAMLPVGY